MTHAVCAVLLISEKAPSPVNNGVDLPYFVGFLLVLNILMYIVL